MGREADRRLKAGSAGGLAAEATLRGQGLRAGLASGAGEDLSKALSPEGGKRPCSRAVRKANQQKCVLF